MKRYFLLIFAILFCAAGNAFSIEDDGIYQGYVEGDYLYIGLQSGGRLMDLNVERGDEVTAGSALFQLDPTREQALLQNKVALLDVAKAEYADLNKGLRPSEIVALRERLNQAKAENALARRTLERQQGLEISGAASEQNLDIAQANFDRTAALIRQIEAELVTAQLGGREDLLVAKERVIHALEADVVAARWALEQRIAIAPTNGFVDDIYYRPGEFVEAGKPVVSYLPPQNIKVRFFIPETILASLTIGTRIEINCDSCDAGLLGEVRFISSKAEFTPPVIYSEEERAKLLYMIEASFIGEAHLKPGQPVDVMVN